MAGLALRRPTLEPEPCGGAPVWRPPGAAGVRPQADRPTICPAVYIYSPMSVAGLRVGVSACGAGSACASESAPPASCVKVPFRRNLLAIVLLSLCSCVALGLAVVHGSSRNWRHLPRPRTTSWGELEGEKKCKPGPNDRTLACF